MKTSLEKEKEEYSKEDKLTRLIFSICLRTVVGLPTKALFRVHD